MQETRTDVQDIEAQRKSIAIEYFDMIRSGRFKDGLRFFAPDCVTHNPYFAGDMSALTDAMIAANKQGVEQYPNAEFIVRHVLADGDMVAVHTDLRSDRSEPKQGGLRQVHLFRFDGDKIVEYWDITQQLMPDMPNADGAF
jgi:predicted SnoaL-like aldol condensation-catalyzing enzyme